MHNQEYNQQLFSYLHRESVHSECENALNL